ncbi:hypothetical protein F7984_14680 [Pradoshia sp. D12]|uniref:hypothetical protein n=1 Tax=Pradoshia sp. D12 TaxID=2651284 RepID=UPI00124F0114|nr:hypothetical protein [Pradoshia sp. D12]QFK72398.1 hypothetical protein F7984_14680 [Pradoshia sp. D12]
MNYQSRFGRFLIGTLVLALFVTCLTPFSAAAAGQEGLSDAEIENKIIEKEFQNVDLNEFDEFEVYEGFASIVPETDSGKIGTRAVLGPDIGGTTYWTTIASGSKKLTKADFYISGAYVVMYTSLLGKWSKTIAAIASALGFAANTVPSALVGEKLKWTKKIKWVSKTKGIYDIKTTEYIERNGKKVTIGERTIREDGEE